tara:strand:+ start:263 stop:715 length:453 start_codon:yes stop_codon:yes gene_type:complete
MYGSIDKHCVVCLSNEGDIILSGCKNCKNGNQYIHKDCLIELKNKGFHNNYCYVCKNKMNDVVIITNDPFCDFIKRFFFVIFIACFCFLLGYLFKMALYTFIVEDREYIKENDYLNYNYYFFDKPIIFLVHEILGFILFIIGYLFYKCCN